MKAYIATLGCKVNQCESSAIGELLQCDGFEILPKQRLSEADVIIVNTCAVTSESEHKSRQTLSSLKRSCPDAVTVLCGCMPQISPHPEKLGADIVIGSKGRSDIPNLLREYLSEHRKNITVRAFAVCEPFEPLVPNGYEDRTRAFLKIEDGCDRFCAYCVIPYSRGPIRSMPLEQVRQKATDIVASGHSEIVLTGINLAAYGVDTGGNLADAVDTAAAAGAKRIRLGSVECDLLTDEFLQRMSLQPAFCPQFHLSLQSGSDGVLKRMNRHYTADDYYALTRKILKLFDNPAFTTDIMEGFPGETDEEFAESIAFVNKVGFSRLHVFNYSPRPGTPAAELPQLEPQIKKLRCEQMAQQGEQLAKRFAVSQIGKTAEVLLEHSKSGVGIGRAKNYTQVEVIDAPDVPGSIHTVKIDAARDDVCIGHTVK